MVTLELPDTLAAALEEEANVEGVSKVTLLAEALKYYRRIRHQRRLEAALHWYSTLPEQQRNLYAGKFVAVYQNEVIDHDADRLALYQRVRDHYGHQPVLIIPAAGPPEFKIITTQLEQL